MRRSEKEAERQDGWSFGDDGTDEKKETRFLFYL